MTYSINNITNNKHSKFRSVKSTFRGRRPNMSRWLLSSMLPVMMLVATFLAMGSVPRVAYAADGDLDPTFGTGGKVTTNWENEDDEINDVKIQADGKIVVAGEATVGGSNRNFGLARYLSNGALDTTFSGNGLENTDFGGHDRARALAIQSDGKIVAVGDSGSYDFAIARYNSNGTLDTSFSTDGKLTLDFAGGLDSAESVVIDQSGRIVVAGSAQNSEQTYGWFAVARFTSNGTPDSTFSGDGKLLTDFGGVSRAEDLVVQPDGQIVVAGYALSNFALARYNPNGTMDTTFSGDGRLTTDFAGAGDDAQAVRLQPDGKIVVAGDVFMGAPTYADFGLARYNPNGDLDLTFSGDGKQATDFGGSEATFGMAIQPNGKIVLSGGSISGTRDFLLARYNPNGDLDLTFSGDGKVTTDFGGLDASFGVALQMDGKIVAVGGYSNYTQSDFALARYQSSSQTPPSPTATATPPGTCSIAFTDVPPSNSFYPFVRCLACRGIDIGYPCGGPGEPCDPQNNRYYRVNNLITRDDLAHMVAASAGFSEPAGTRRFQDVPIAHQYYVWIQRMANRGLIGGYPCGTQQAEPCVAPDNLPYYRPSAQATRGQIAKIVSNGAGYSEPPQGQTFEDVPPSHTFYEWVQRLTSRSVMGGYPCGGAGEPCVAPNNRPYFRWQNNATRGQVTKITANTFFPGCNPPEAP